MSTEYIVTCEGTVTERYSVMADSPDEALKNWVDGLLISSEASTGPSEVEVAE